MMSPDTNSTLKNPHVKESSTGNKKSSSTKPQQASSSQPHLNCPRCDSPNTKFCYYNNYSLSQPRHFCKTCRRYWTKGGALRNVPIGGGCRKNKKMIKSSANSSRVSGNHHSNDSSAISSDQIIGGLKLNFFQGVTPAMDFQLGGLLNLPRLQSPINTGGTGLFDNNQQFSTNYGGLSNYTCGPAPSSSFSLDHPGNSSTNFMGLSSSTNFPLSSAPGFQEIGSSLSSFNSSPNLASSIESLSSLNQDLHWKLQQQRLAMLYAGDNQKENVMSDTTHNSSSVSCAETLVHKPQPILFQNLEINESCGLGTSRKDSGGGEALATEWYFDSSLAVVNPRTQASNVVNNENTGTWNSTGIQTWSDNSNHYSALP